MTAAAGLAFLLAAVAAVADWWSVRTDRREVESVVARPWSGVPGSGRPCWAASSRSTFAASDALLAWGRFVGPAPGGRVAVHVTYHVAQALLVLALPTLA